MRTVARLALAVHLALVPVAAGAGFTAAPVSQAAWTPYTPTVTAETPGATPPTFTVNAAGYTLVGKTLVWRVDVTVTAAGTGSGRIVVPMPVALQGANQSGYGYNTASGKGTTAVTSGNSFLVGNTDATTPIATGARVIASGVSEVL
jgi:hypothetical protein